MRRHQQQAATQKQAETTEQISQPIQGTQATQRLHSPLLAVTGYSQEIPAGLQRPPDFITPSCTIQHSTQNVHSHTLQVASCHRSNPVPTHLLLTAHNPCISTHETPCTTQSPC
jgi:hypothetical protein